MRISELTEARRNPEQNPKTPINQIIKDQLKNTQEWIAGTPNLFVSFTELEKLGVNPNSSHGITPNGIYAYQAKYVVESVGDYSHMDTLPYAGDATYVNIFSVSGNIVDLGTLSDGELSRYMSRATRALADQTGMDTGSYMDKFMEFSHRHGMSNGQMLWYFTRNVASDIARHRGKGTSTTAWSGIFRAIGIDGCVDNGHSIIQPNEPTQAVFFSTQVIDLKGRYHNKYSPLSTDMAKTNAGADQEARRTARGMKTEQHVIDFLSQSYDLSFLKYVTDTDIKIAAIQHGPQHAIMFIPKPTPSEQMASLVATRGESIKHIAKSDQKTVGEFLARDGMGYGVHPDHTIKLIISKIPNPTDPTLQRVLVSHNLENIRLIPNPSRDLVNFALKAYAQHPWQDYHKDLANKLAQDYDITV